MRSTGQRKPVGIGSRDEMRTVIVAAALVRERGRILVTQRKEGSSHGLLWEFPGGKVEEEEDPREALKRELKEELDVEASAGMMFNAAFYFYPEYPILLLVYDCRIDKGSLKPIGCRDLRWVTVRELRKLAMPPADDVIREHLALL